MSNDYWVKIVKNGFFYIVEKWQVGENRITFVEKKKTLTKYGASKHAKKYIVNKIVSDFIKEKIYE